MAHNYEREGAQQKLILRTRDGNFVSTISLWRQRLGLDLGPNGRGALWLYITIICFIISTVSQVLALFQATDDSAKMLECVSVGTFCAMGLLKLYSLKGRYRHWYSLLSNASELEIKELNYGNPNEEYESEDEEDNTFQIQITKYTQKFKSTSKLLIRIYVSTALIYILSPFVEYAVWKIQGTEILEYPHILPVWTELEKIFFPIYVVTVLAELTASVYCVAVHIIFDLSIVGIMIFIHGQFILLCKSCERIGGEGRVCDLSLKRDLRAHFRIARCQRIHASLINSVNELSSISKSILGIYFNVATLTLCSVAVQVLSEELSTTQLLTLLQYMCASLTQLFLFCYYGDDVINKSSVSLGEGPSASAWWCLNPHIRREVALLFVSMTRRCRLLAGPFHFVNLPTFIQIIRTAYSYYAVIRQRASN